MLRYAPTQNMVEESGYKWLKEYEASYVLDFELLPDALILKKQGIELPIDDITNIYIGDGEKDKRVPNNDEYSGVPLYYGLFEIRATILYIVSPLLKTKDNEVALGAFHSPSCRLTGAKWVPRLPDTHERNCRLSNLMSIYKNMGRRVRTNHIIKACERLKKGLDVADCGEKNIIFHPSWVTVFQFKPGIMGAVFGKRESFSCEYSDLNCEVNGDPLFPDLVVVKIKGHPNADLRYEKRNDVVSPYLIKPILNMMNHNHHGSETTTKTSSKLASTEERLNILLQLHNTGCITKQEYDAKRQAILDSI